MWFTYTAKVWNYTLDNVRALEPTLEATETPPLDAFKDIVILT